MCNGKLSEENGELNKLDHFFDNHSNGPKSWKKILSLSKSSGVWFRFAFLFTLYFNFTEENFLNCIWCMKSVSFSSTSHLICVCAWNSFQFITLSAPASSQSQWTKIQEGLPISAIHYLDLWVRFVKNMFTIMVSLNQLDNFLSNWNYISVEQIKIIVTLCSRIILRSRIFVYLHLVPCF